MHTHQPYLKGSAVRLLIAALALGPMIGVASADPVSVPVSLDLSQIQATAATCTADNWAPHSVLERDPQTKAVVQKYDDAEKDYADRVTRYLEEYREQVRKAVADGKDAPAGRPPENSFRERQRPAGLYNGMVAPLQPYALSGVAWYQGESDADNAA